jgi:hypothetical protein
MKNTKTLAIWVASKAARVNLLKQAIARVESQRWNLFRGQQLRRLKAELAKYETPSLF